jgi:hypothetical protein
VGDVTISGGTVGEHFNAFGSSTINISGGTIGQGFDARTGSEINISGGEFGEGLDALSGSFISIFGHSFKLDGVPIGSKLEFEVPFKVVDRNVTLTGIFADGTPFNFDLNSTKIVGKDFFHRDAIVNVTLVPEPSALAALVSGIVLISCRRKVAATQARGTFKTLGGSATGIIQ